MFYEKFTVPPSIANAMMQLTRTPNQQGTYISEIPAIYNKQGTISKATNTIPMATNTPNQSNTDDSGLQEKGEKPNRDTTSDKDSQLVSRKGSVRTDIQIPTAPKQARKFVVTTIDPTIPRVNRVGQYNNSQYGLNLNIGAANIEKKDGRNYELDIKEGLQLPIKYTSISKLFIFLLIIVILLTIFDKQILKIINSFNKVKRKL